MKKCHHEYTVIFDNVIKPHFIKVEDTLRAHAHLDQRSAVFNEHRFDTCLSILTLNMIFNDFQRFLIIQFVHKSPCDFINSDEIQEKQTEMQFSPNTVEQSHVKSLSPTEITSTLLASLTKIASLILLAFLAPDNLRTLALKHYKRY